MVEYTRNRFMMDVRCGKHMDFPYVTEGTFKWIANGKLRLPHAI
jgi:hypothetical protein